MRRIALVLFVCMLATLVSGCNLLAVESASKDAELSSPKGEFFNPGRMLIWRVSLSLEVSNVKKAVSLVEDIAKQSGGYVEEKADWGEKNARVTIRVPVNSMMSTVESLGAVGKVTGRHVSSRDVTEEYVDVDARLKTMTALRDRLQALLDKAENVQDVLAIEKELSRVQADIDSMQARLKVLKGQVDLATIEVSLERRQILGPIGYLLQGTFWVVEKLFVIQE